MLEYPAPVRTRFASVAVGGTSPCSESEAVLLVLYEKCSGSCSWEVNFTAIILSAK